jgi:hypothetical protein
MMTVLKNVYGKKTGKYFYIINSSWRSRYKIGGIDIRQNHVVNAVTQDMMSNIWEEFECTLTRLVTTGFVAPGQILFILSQTCAVTY